MELSKADYTNTFRNLAKIHKNEEEETGMGVLNLPDGMCKEAQEQWR